jgi:lysine-N-methylase
LQLPVFQHFDCHSCGHCCRDAVVNVTSAERDAVVAAGWEERMSGETLFVDYRFGGRRLIRIAQRAGGQCIFLAEDGRCRLHAETGLATKPLACRLYPFVPVPGVGSIRLDMRFDCPSVAANRGRSLSTKRSEVAALARETNVEIEAGVLAWGGLRLTAEEADALVAAFDACLTERKLALRRRIAAAAHLLDLLLTIRPGRVRGKQFAELMQLLIADAIEQARESAVQAAPVLRGGGRGSLASSRTQRLFRQWLFLHTIADDAAELACGPLERLRRSWRRYGQSRCFAAGEGVVPRVRADWPVMTFEQLAAIAPPDDEALEPLIRAMRVKLQAHAFAGPAYFGYDLLPGLTALMLLPALVGWMARVQAVCGGHNAVSADDLLEGLRQVHRTFAVSPVFARISERLRLRALAGPGVTAALGAIYSP